MTEKCKAGSTRGLWLQREKVASTLQRDLHAMVIDAIIDALAEISGRAAAQEIRTRGLEHLHEALEVTEIGQLRDAVLESLRDDLLRMAVDIGRSQLGWKHDFYVDDYLILRVNFPYEVARRASYEGENPGIGRLSPSMREVAAARRVKDPLFDPTEYHRGHPPAAWAHGPHLDSWAGHSRDGLNLWWAICDVPVEASMVLYPTVERDSLACDRRTLYLQSGIALPKPTFVPLKAGDLLIFDPEILHGTHLNVTHQTRVAISLRLNAAKPTFDPACFYAREFWRTAADIEQNRRDRVLHLKREDNLVNGTTTSHRTPAPNFRRIEAQMLDRGQSLRLASHSVDPGQTVTIEASGNRVHVLRGETGLTAYSAACPHYGVDLSDGSTDGGGIYCPACAVRFDTATGRSSSPCLSLTMLAVGEADGWITVTFPVSQASAAAAAITTREDLAT